VSEGSTPRKRGDGVREVSVRKSRLIEDPVYAGIEKKRTGGDIGGSLREPAAKNTFD